MGAVQDGNGKIGEARLKHPTFNGVRASPSSSPGRASAQSGIVEMSRNRFRFCVRRDRRRSNKLLKAPTPAFGQALSALFERKASSICDWGPASCAAAML
jgi:hypothetical protein